MLSLPREFVDADEVRVAMVDDTASERCKIVSFSEKYLVIEPLADEVRGNLVLIPWSNIGAISVKKRDHDHAEAKK